MIRYSISFTAGELMQLTAGINRQVLPLLNQAVRAVAQQTAIEWQEAIMRAKLWSGEKDAYVKTITWEMKGDFSAFVSTDYKHAAEIETGRPARDLKRMLDTSTKVRRTKSGKRFLVIPMRHNTSGNDAHAPAMPNSVSRLAKAMEPSRVVNTGERPSGQVVHLSPKTGMSPAAEQTPYLSSLANRKAAQVASREYAWGGRLTRSALKQAGVGLADRKRYGGMVRMDNTSPSGAKSSSFLTFRIMMEGSRGWVVPAQPGQYIIKGVADSMRPKANAAFEAAVTKTVQG